jgi:hypothetical protein
MESAIWPISEWRSRNYLHVCSSHAPLACSLGSVTHQGRRPTHRLAALLLLTSSPDPLLAVCTGLWRLLGPEVVETDALKPALSGYLVFFFLVFFLLFLSREAGRTGYPLVSMMTTRIDPSCSMTSRPADRQVGEAWQAKITGRFGGIAGRRVPRSLFSWRQSCTCTTG